MPQLVTPSGAGFGAVMPDAQPRPVPQLLCPGDAAPELFELALARPETCCWFFFLRCGHGEEESRSTTTLGVSTALRRGDSRLRRQRESIRRRAVGTASHSPWEGADGFAQRRAHATVGRGEVVRHSCFQGKASFFRHARGASRGRSGTEIVFTFNLCGWPQVRVSFSTQMFLSKMLAQLLVNK